MNFYSRNVPRQLQANLWVLLVLIAVLPHARALDIVFDFTYDTGNFFGSAGSAQRNALDEAASFFETVLVDDLDAITPSGPNTWNAVFFDPTNSGSNLSVVNPTIAADTLLIYVGSEDRGIGNLALAAPGGYGVTAVTQEFFDAVTTRGEVGMTPNTSNDDTDFGVWGGSMSFNDNATIDWNFDTSISPPAGEYDFYSTALHEMTHIFGFSTSESYENLINGSDQFTGAAGVAENGGLIQLTDDGHIDDAVMSTVFGTAIAQAPIMNDAGGTGSRELMTDLDVAMLQDTGWEVVPEPGSALLVFGGCGILMLRRRRKNTDQGE